MVRSSSTGPCRLCSTARWPPSCWPRSMSRAPCVGCCSSGPTRRVSRDGRASTRPAPRRAGGSKARTIPPERIVSSATTERIRRPGPRRVLGRGRGRCTVVPRDRRRACRAPGTSSVGRSASSRRSSTASPTCWSRSSRRWRAPGTRQAPRRRVADAGDRLAVQLAAALALDGYLEARQGDASRSSAAWGSPGSTMRTSTSDGRPRCASCWAAPGRLRAEGARLALDGARRRLSMDLPPEADQLREELRPLIEGIAAIGDPAEQRIALADAGLLGAALAGAVGSRRRPGRTAGHRRAASGIELRRPNLAVAAWALPTIIAHGTPEQKERWVAPTLHGDTLAGASCSANPARAPTSPR